jgi:integrase
LVQQITSFVLPFGTPLYQSPPLAHSLKLVLRKDKARASDGTAPVWMRVTANRKSRYRSTGVRVEPKHWNEKRAEVRRSHPLCTALNARLEAALAEAASTLADAKTSAEALRAVRPESMTLSAYARRHLDELEASGAFWERKKYATTLSKLEAALGSTVDADALTPDALRTFERYLTTKAGPKGRGNGPNTVRRELGRLRTLIRKAVKEGVLTSNPFDLYDMPKGRTVNRRKLTPDEMQALASLDLDAGSLPRVVRDAFLFAFYAGGMRFGDVCTLRPSNLVRDGARVRVSYRMMKTGTLVSLPLPPVALDLLRPYTAPSEEGQSTPAAAFVFPLISDARVPSRDASAEGVRLRRRIASRNTQANEALKALAKEAGLADPDAVSFHVARHSFADYARQASGNVYAVSKALGHKSLTITEAYLRSFDQDATDKLQDDLWSR